MGLAAVAGGEHSHLRRQFRGYVEHCLTVVDQAVGDVFADAVAALDRPDPIGVLAAGGEHVGVAGLVSPEAAHREHPAAFVDDLDGC